ncbi:hypothetical protein L1987_06299 [Smallanthus sonchifolius]|uniref:Uncharacterized protein n=1 Tax=Smallanthus sonchifolius TaxID=185202 RepID=A0ACB9JXY5_9ASTR|nr:hypothetical protein L1987_06299 [Smallanthus sonchifolius]
MVLVEGRTAIHESLRPALRCINLLIMVILEYLYNILHVKLHGTNFLTWYYNLKNVLRFNKKLHVLKFPLPKQSLENASEFVLNAWNKLKDDTNAKSNLMLASVSPGIRESLQCLTTYDMIRNLKDRYHQDYNKDPSHSLMSHIRDVALENPRRDMIMRKKVVDLKKACIL